jgi:hypothetical protein
MTYKIIYGKITGISINHINIYIYFNNIGDIGMNWTYLYNYITLYKSPTKAYNHYYNHLNESFIYIMGIMGYSKY